MPPVPTWRVRHRSRASWEKSFSRGCQDQAQAHGQDPCAVLPDHRRRRPHQAGWPGDRGDRQVSPQGRALPHRGRLGSSPVLAVGGGAADAKAADGKAEPKADKGKARKPAAAAGKAAGEPEKPASAAKDGAAKDGAAKDSAAKDSAAKDTAVKEEPAKEESANDAAAKEESAKE